MFQLLRKVFLMFVTSSNFGFMAEHGYLPQKFGDKTIYSNGTCAWYSDTIKETPIWRLKKSIYSEMKMFDNNPVRYKLISQQREWGWNDTVIIETTDIGRVADEYSKLYENHFRVFDSPSPCIHVYKGEARVAVYKGIHFSKDMVLKELNSVLQ